MFYYLSAHIKETPILSCVSPPGGNARFIWESLGKGNMNRKIMVLSALTALIAAAGIIVWLIMQNAPRRDPAAEIYLDGELIKTVSLAEECEFTVECGGGFNTVSVLGGAIAVTDADCPDKVCVHTGAISGGAVPIVCLPHRLEIRIVDGVNSANGANGLDNVDAEI